MNTFNNMNQTIKFGFRKKYESCYTDSIQRWGQETTHAHTPSSSALFKKTMSTRSLHIRHLQRLPMLNFILQKRLPSFRRPTVHMMIELTLVSFVFFCISRSCLSGR